MAINFFTENIKINLNNKRRLKAWLSEMIKSNNYLLGDVNYIFCTDTYLHEINLKHLNHDTYTDIITFDNSEHENEIEGDIFISVDRVRENATTHSKDFKDELLRVLVHGVLHLMGYLDKTQKDIEQMRIAEDKAIDLYKSLDVPRETLQ